MAEQIKIQFLRGTEAQVLAAPVDEGKPYYATDTGRLFIGGTGTKHFAGKALYGAEASLPTPITILNGALYVCTDTKKTYVCNGTAWLVVSMSDLADFTGDLDDITDGTTYGKVLNTELESNQVVRLKVSGGGILTAVDIKAHMDDTSIHTSINDTVPSSSEVYSSQKVEEELGKIIMGMIRGKKVETITSTPPTGLTPAETGYRYIVGPGATTPWVGKDTQIATWTGTAWVYTIPEEGMIVYNDFDNKDYLFVDDGVPQWEAREITVTDHTGLTNINGDNNYQHLTLAQKTTATSLATTSDTGLMSAGDKLKLDNIESGAQVNQDITAGAGILRTDSNGANGDAILEADFEDSGANIGAVLKGSGTGSAGTSDKVARADHQHRITDMDAGTL